MPLIKINRKKLLLSIILAMIFDIHFTSIFFAMAEEEHTYVIFYDDFEDGEVENWMMTIPPSAPPDSSWSVIQDEDNHVLKEKGHVWAEVGDFTWTNYTLEVKAKLLTTQGGHINFRISGPGRYILGFYSDGLYLRKEYPANTFHHFEELRMPLNLNRWYTFRIVCVGNSIRVYLDGVLKFDYIDEEEPLLSGRIGLESGPEAQVYYDDIKVSTTHRLYVLHLMGEAQEEIDEAKTLGVDTTEAEERLSEAQEALKEGDLSLAEALAGEAINLAKTAPVGYISVGTLLEHPTEYDQRIVEVSGTIRDIRYEEGLYRFVIDDGTGVISATFNRTLGEIREEDDVKVVGLFDAATKIITVESLERIKAPTEGLYTFLILKDDFEDGDFSGWGIDIDPNVAGSMWKIEKDDNNYILSGEGHCWSQIGDPEWTDYVFELKIKLIKGMVQINFRMITTSEGQRRYILRLNHGLVLVKEYIYLNEVRSKNLKSYSIDLNPTIWYNIKIVCLGNNIKIYVDDALKINYTDEENPHLSGLIGLEPITYNGESSHIHFDDIRVAKIATTSDINDLITYAQSEIDKAKEINADVSTAELKLEQAKSALAQEDYRMVQYLVDEAVWLAKRASIGQIFIRDLKAMATKCSGHTVIIVGTIKDIKAHYGVGYDFTLEDETDKISVTYQGTLADVKEGSKVRVTGIFDAPAITVFASQVEVISGPPAPQEPTPEAPTQPPGGVPGITWSIELITGLISISAAGVGVFGWIAKTRSIRRRKKILFKRLMEEIDDVYSRFKMNARRCETELYRLKDEVLDEFKAGMIDEENYNILIERIDDCMKEIREQIKKEN